MSEPFDFPRELRCDSVMLAKSHPYTADMLGRAATEIELLCDTTGTLTTQVLWWEDQYRIQEAEIERLREALGDVVDARMPGQARVIAAKAMRDAVGSGKQSQEKQ